MGVALRDIVVRIQHTALSHAVSESNHLVIAGLQVLHVFGFLLLLASLTLMSLRLLGLVLTEHTVPRVVREPARLMRAGLTLAVTSGVLIFLSGPEHYYDNGAFDVKMLLLLAALTVQATLYRRVAAAEHASPILARATATVSLLLWFGVGIAGRAIGFV